MLAVVLILGMIYAAAIVLVVRDRIFLQPEYVPKPKPNVRRSRWWLMVLIPLWSFGLAMWLIVCGPVIAGGWIVQKVGGFCRKLVIS